ncbi:hypothetical protein BBP40_010938 [Aspergillus hancockii]|nr:hypothetical protein BBP40_010938 [Aspergillus hancockii]
MSKGQPPKYEDIPSYEDSIRSPPPTEKSPHSIATTPPLHRHLDESRLQRVQSILTQYIDPLLSQQASSGLYKATFILIPSNTTSLQPSAQTNSEPTPKDPEVVGFPASTVVKLVQLHGEEHTTEFWRQPAVLRELESSLRARLAASGHQLEGVDEGSVTDGVTGSRGQDESGSKGKKKGFWERFTGRSEAVAIVDRKLGWRADEEATSRKLVKDQARVGVEWKEVCLRVESYIDLKHM